MIADTRSGRSDINPCIASSRLAATAIAASEVEPDRRSSTRVSADHGSTPAPTTSARGLAFRNRVLQERQIASGDCVRRRFTDFYPAEMLIKCGGERIGENRQGGATVVRYEPDRSFEQGAPDPGPDGRRFDEQQRQVELSLSFHRLEGSNTHQTAALSFGDEDSALRDLRVCDGQRVCRLPHKLGLIAPMRLGADAQLREPLCLLGSGWANPDHRPEKSEPPHQPNQTALNLDTVGPEDTGFVRLVGRFERNRGAAAAQPLQSDLLIVDQCHNDHAILRGVAALDDHRIAVENAGLDHAVAGYLKGIMLAAPPK